MFPRTRNISTILAKALGQNRICFSAHRPKVMKRIKISLKRTSKQSPGNVEVSFDKPAGNFCGKCERFLLTIWKLYKLYNVFFPKKIVKTFPCGRELWFWQPCWNFSARSLKKTRSKCGSRKKTVLVFFKKKLFLSKMFVRTRSILTIVPEVFRQKWICFLLIVWKWWRSCKFLKKEPQSSPPKMLKLVLINLLETFAESANVFCSQSGNCISYIMFFFPKKILKTFLRTRRVQFSQPCWNSFVKI